jgi:SAM-dependent methyltransferase
MERRRVRLLEAGCGSSTYIKFNATVYAIGIDISQAQRDKNKVLAEKILGDIQSYPLPRDSFDVAVCWMVLEHLADPEAALRHMFQSVKSGGLVLLGFPHLMSFKGLVTKITPYWIHKILLPAIEVYEKPVPKVFAHSDPPEESDSLGRTQWIFRRKIRPRRGKPIPADQKDVSTHLLGIDFRERGRPSPVFRQAKYASR